MPTLRRENRRIQNDFRSTGKPPNIITKRRITTGTMRKLTEFYLQKLKDKSWQREALDDYPRKREIEDRPQPITIMNYKTGEIRTGIVGRFGMISPRS